MLKKLKAGEWNLHIERLEENKIKVTLTRADLLSMNIDINKLGSESTELNSFLFRLMERIREETGFNPYGGQVLMEAMPTVDGINIFVSKVKGDIGKVNVGIGKPSGSTGKKISRERFNKLKSVRVKKEKPEAEGKKKAQSVCMETFYIDNFDDVCGVLTNIKYSVLLKCALYRLEERYCVLIPRTLKNISAMGVLTEFSCGRASSPMTEIYVAEHGELIAKGRKLANMGKGIRNLED